MSTTDWKYGCMQLHIHSRRITKYESLHTPSIHALKCASEMRSFIRASRSLIVRVFNRACRHSFAARTQTLANTQTWHTQSRTQYSQITHAQTLTHATDRMPDTLQQHGSCPYRSRNGKTRTRNKMTWAEIAWEKHEHGQRNMYYPSHVQLPSLILCYSSAGPTLPVREAIQCCVNTRGPARVRSQQR